MTFPRLELAEVMLIQRRDTTGSQVSGQGDERGIDHADPKSPLGLGHIQRVGNRIRHQWTR